MLRPRLEEEGRWDDMLTDLRSMYDEVNQSGGSGVAFDGEYLVSLGSKPS